MKNISILGSTGSIGVQALEVIKKNSSKFKVIALGCHSNIHLLEQQIKAFNPEIVSVFDESKAEELQKRVKIDVLSGMEGLMAISKLNSADMVLNALVGSIGVKPTIEAIKAKKDIALANKETLVTAGEIVMNLAKKKGVAIKPIDSEHSAIFQCINGENPKKIRKIILTCSGGAFRDKTKKELEKATAEAALKHPNWNMGKKITIDSATLMNKGFEVIEARMLFGVDYDNIQVVIHPQSIVHSLVEFRDGSVIAQLGVPDMRLPIQYALSHPKRIDANFASLDLLKVSQLNFSSPDTERFPCLKYAYEAGKTGGTMPCVMNAVNEVLVRAFLEGKIGFMDIPRIIKKTMDAHRVIRHPGLDDILALDKKIKKKTEREIENG